MSKNLFFAELKIAFGGLIFMILIIIPRSAAQITDDFSLTVRVSKSVGRSYFDDFSVWIL